MCLLEKSVFSIFQLHGQGWIKNKSVWRPQGLHLAPIWPTSLVAQLAAAASDERIDRQSKKKNNKKEKQNI